VDKQPATGQSAHTRRPDRRRIAAVARQRPAADAGPTAGRRPPTAGRAQAPVDRLVIVALDPGHGGEDPGAIGPTGLREKDVVLAVAWQLRDRSMRAWHARHADARRRLLRAAERARAQGAAGAGRPVRLDPRRRLLHAEARGASVFALSDRGATSTAARWMADKENAADVVGGVNRRR
jgi:N-acetylmuramoyl-L-alanine amidase